MPWIMALGMTHSIVDVSGIDHDGDGIVSRIYAGDLGGNIFALKDDVTQSFCSDTVFESVVDGAWTSQKLFSASAVDNVQRKIFYAPDAVGEDFGEVIFFGTGDRTDPNETDVVNRFYAIKNDWSVADTLDETDLVDVTDDLIQLGTEAQKLATKPVLKTAAAGLSGWRTREKKWWHLPGYMAVWSISPLIHRIPAAAAVEIRAPLPPSGGWAVFTR